MKSVFELFSSFGESENLSRPYEDKFIFSKMQIIPENMHNDCAYFPPAVYIVWCTFAAQ